MGIKSCAYLRVSTDQQDISSQKFKIEEFAQSHGYDIERWFIDEALSGTLEDRPQLLALKEWVPRNEGKSVLMVGLDRLARNFAIYAEFSTLFASHEVHPVYLNCPTIGEPSVDTLLQNIMASFAAYERDVIRDRLQRGKDFKLKHGIIAAGGPPLFGYKFRTEFLPTGKKNKFYEVDEKEAEIVRMMFRMLLDGWRTQAIARELTRMQVTNRKGNHRWAPSSVRNFLSATTYMGEFRYGKTKMSGVGRNRREVPRAVDEQLVVPVPAIISKSEFEKAQEILKRLGQGLQGRSRKHSFLLSGRLKCGKCHYWYSGGGRKTGKINHTYYRCNSIARYGSDGKHLSCGNPSLRTQKADDAVWKALSDILVNPQKIQEADDIVNREQEVEGIYSDMIVILKERGGVEQEEKRLISAYAKGLFDEKGIEEYRKELDKKWNRLTDRLTELNLQVHTEFNEIDELRMKPRTRKELARYTTEQKIEEVKRYVSEVKVLPTQPTKLEITFNLPVKLPKKIVDVMEATVKKTKNVVATDQGLEVVGI